MLFQQAVWHSPFRLLKWMWIWKLRLTKITKKIIIGLPIKRDCIKCVVQPHWKGIWFRIVSRTWTKAWLDRLPLQCEVRLDKLFRNGNSSNHFWTILPGTVPLYFIWPRRGKMSEIPTSYGCWGFNMWDYLTSTWLGQCLISVYCYYSERIL